MAPAEPLGPEALCRRGALWMAARRPVSQPIACACAGVGPERIDDRIRLVVLHTDQSRPGEVEAALTRWGGTDG